jgi:hypothetical protein
MSFPFCIMANHGVRLDVPSYSHEQNHFQPLYPRTIGLRTFQTEEEYNEAVADFLNGY